MTVTSWHFLHLNLCLHVCMSRQLAARAWAQRWALCEWWRMNPEFRGSSLPAGSVWLSLNCKNILQIKSHSDSQADHLIVLNVVLVAKRNSPLPLWFQRMSHGLRFWLHQDESVEVVGFHYKRHLPFCNWELILLNGYHK